MREEDKKLMNHKFIVFCGDHYNPLGVVRSLGEKGIKPIVILVAQKARLIPLSRYVGKIHRVADMKTGLKVLVEQYGEEEEKPFVYTCSDEIASLLDQNHNQLIDKFFFFHGRQQGSITQYLDKKNINDLAAKHGCKVLKSEIVKKGELPKTLTYPIITKAVNSILYDWKREMHICSNEEELLNAYENMRGETVLVQEYIYKKNEYCVDGFSYNAGENVEITYVANYIRFSDISYGGYMVMHLLDRKEVYDQLKNMLKEIGYTGIFCAEFLIDKNDELYFLEINLRNSGWSYASTYGGYNMPYLWAKASLERCLDMSIIEPRKRFTAIAEWDDYEVSVKTGQISFLTWLKSFLGANCHYSFNWKDPLPFLRCIYRPLINRIKRIFIKPRRWTA